MSIGIFRGEHSFNAIINQTDKVITPINPFDNNARALLKSPASSRSSSSRTRRTLTRSCASRAC